jgi:BolA protein
VSGVQENAAGIVESMELRLAALEPDLVEIYDESGEHIGHAGAQSGGGHYQLTIVARRFEGQSRVARHRLVYDALGEMMRKEIHALAITALTPEELREVWPTDEPRAGR